MIERPRMWNRVLSPAEVAALYAADQEPSALERFWRLVNGKLEARWKSRSS